MDKSFKFALPPPDFNKNVKDAFKPKPHYLTPSGMSLLPREKQPPPMYGKHGATLPAKFLRQQIVGDQQNALPTSPPEKQYCTSCDLELHSLEDLKRHRAQHEKCPVAGCLFKGHPSVMDKHVSALHASGLFDKFKKLSSPEEIAAWREERRKRYPTLANVLLKQKAKEQRQKRGERLENNRNRFGKVNDKKRAQPHFQGDKSHPSEQKHREENRTNNKKNRKNKNKKPKNLELKPKIQNGKDDEILVDVELSNCCGVSMFRGTCQLKDYTHFNEKKNPAANNALFGLVGMYGSDDDDDEFDENGGDHQDVLGTNETEKITERDDDNSDNIFLQIHTEKQEGHEDLQIRNVSLNSDCHGFDSNRAVFEYNNDIQLSKSLCDTEKMQHSAEKTTLLSFPSVENAPCFESNEQFDGNINPSDDEPPEETPIQRNNPDLPTKSENDPKLASLKDSEAKCRNTKLEDMVMSKPKQILKRKYGLDYRKARLRKQNTMLEKLLESDIRHERNVLLQCVRFVCENNFFNICQNNKGESLQKNR